MRSVVITGASTGIGWATTKLLLDRGFRVFGSVRRQADAERLRREFGANFIPLLFDVTEEAAVLAAAREVRTALGGETLAGLINNAGIAVTGPVLGLAADEFRRQLDVNVIGPVIATQAFAPLLGADASLRGAKGRIVMVSSLAGKNGNPLTSAYSASKHALEGFSEGLRRELMLFGCHHRRAGRGEHADLEQGRGSRCFSLPEFAILSGDGKNSEIHARTWRERIAAGTGSGSDLRRADVGKPRGALPDRTGSGAAVHDQCPAETDG
jgi:NADP-dependent 3-hydroxy acid dehydrogenase YdfG